MQQISATGAPWYYEDDYEAFRQLLPERSWHPTFAEWEAAAEANIQRLRNDGHVIYKAPVRSNEFREWCAAHDLPVDKGSLSQYGAAYAATAFREGRLP
jgi:hypothetical protein